MTDSEREFHEVPVNWKRFFVFAAFAKSVVAGAGIGLALLGVIDITFTFSAESWWSAINLDDSALKWFATLGALMGLLLQLASRYNLTE